MITNPSRHRVRPYLEGALLVAMGLVLSSFTIYRAPLGGSITLGSTIPVCIVSLRWGVKIGVLAGVAFGFLSFIAFGPLVGLEPFLMDFVLAYACLGLCGIFVNYPILGVLISQLLRFVCHVTSGVIFFAEGQELYSAFVFSLQYNAFYLIPDTLIGVLIFHRLMSSSALRQS